MDKIQIKLIAEKIRDRFKPERIILFGSYAYGEPTRVSDIDLLVIMNTELRFPKQSAQIRLYLDETVGVNFPMDITVREIIRTYFKIAEEKI